MSDEEFFADCEATFGPECAQRVARAVAEARRFSPEQILHGKRLFASFPAARPADSASKAA